MPEMLGALPAQALVSSAPHLWKTVESFMVGFFFTSLISSDSALRTNSWWCGGGEREGWVG